MGRPVVTEARVAVERWTTMIDPDYGEVTLPGCPLLRFAPDGRCQDLRSTGRSSPAGTARPTAGATRAVASCVRAGDEALLLAV